MKVDPPKYPLRFLRWFCRPEYVEEIEGDLVELFELRSDGSVTRARRRFYWDVMKTIRWINIRRIKINNMVMNSIRNFIKIYFRRFRHDRVHSTVNILGLTLGISVLFLTLVYVDDEYSIDGFHENANRIYRVVEESTAEDGSKHLWTSNANPMWEALPEEFPEIEKAAFMVYLGSSTLKNGEVAYAERNYAMTTREIFDILDFDILSGDPKAEFPGVLGLVISESMARKLFGSQDPVGKLVEMPDRADDPVQVLAVYRDMPKNSTYQFAALHVMNLDQWPEGWRNYFNRWDSRFFCTWVLLQENADPKQVLEKKQEFIEKYMPEDIRHEHDFFLQNVQDMHLHSTDFEPDGSEPLLAIPYSDQNFVTVILLIGIAVIVIAGLNYVNLATVQSLKRSLEVGVRKVNGATIGNLRFQLFVETSTTVIIAYVIGLFLIYFLLPFFNAITSKEISIVDFFNPEMIRYQVITLVGISFLAGVIPAIFYSRLSRTIRLEKNAFVGGGELLRKAFITVQYGISSVLVVAVLVLFRQLSFIEDKDLGFEKEGIITLDINSRVLRNSFKSIKQDLLQNSTISTVSASSRVPGEWKFVPEVRLKNTLNSEGIESTLYGADLDWIETYNLELTAGNNFSGNDQTDSLKVLLNEQAARLLDLEDPVGKNIFITGRDTSYVRIAGIIKDFHFESLYESITPIVIRSWNNPTMGIDYYSIKFAGDPQTAINHIQKVNDQYDPNTPAEINFLEDKWDRYYQAEQSRSTLFLIGSVVSILISIVGLFGMINFTIERRTKEIGIRKVLGASKDSIVQIILKDYLILLAIALLVAFPCAYWWLEEWLSAFAYRISIGVDIFLLALFVVIIVSCVTVVIRILQAASVNPVRSLRYE